MGEGEVGETPEEVVGIMQEPRTENHHEGNIYSPNGLLRTELEQGELSIGSKERDNIVAGLQNDVQRILETPPPEEIIGKYPEVQARIFALNERIHHLGERNGYTNPPWDKAWQKDETPKAKRFWGEYLTRTFDKIIEEGFWACSDPATIYVALGRKLSLDVHYVSAVKIERVKGDHEEDPNQHAFVEVRVGGDTVVLYEPFDFTPSATIIRTPEGFKLTTKIREEKRGWREESLISTSLEEDFEEVVKQAYNRLGYTKWREDGDPKGIRVKGLEDMIEQVKKDMK